MPLCLGKSASRLRVCVSEVTFIATPDSNAPQKDTMKQRFKQFQAWCRQKLKRWLRRNPTSLRLLRRFRCFHTDPEALRRGLAVGVFFGLTPTVGFQTPMVVAACLLLRGNFPLAFAATWISNPITMAPLYLALNAVGEVLIGNTVLSENTTTGYPLFSLFAGESLQMIVGTLVIATPTACLVYLLARHWQPATPGLAKNQNL